MATVETQKKMEKEEFVYPGSEFYAGIMRMLTEKTPVKIAMVSQHSGDVVFTCTCSDMGLTPQALSHPFCRTHLFADVLGEILLRQNLDLFCSRVMGLKNYDSLVREFNHRDFGLRMHGTELLLFQFHVSLVYRLLNEAISREIADEVSKIILSSPRKVKMGQENRSVTIYTDKKNIRLVVPKADCDRQGFGDAIQSILEFYGVTGKDVSVTTNHFNYEVQVKDKAK